MPTLTLYHRAYAEDRESIFAQGLLPRRPMDDGSAAVASGNPAGAAVYLWKRQPGSESIWYDPQYDDLWEVVVDAEDIVDDPMLPEESACCPWAIPPQALKLVNTGKK